MRLTAGPIEIRVLLIIFSVSTGGWLFDLWLLWHDFFFVSIIQFNDKFLIPPLMINFVLASTASSICMQKINAEHLL